jgi:ParB-like chromosome segregation protein Spo0J
MLQQIPVTSIVVEERMRELDEIKVLELMQSFEQVGVINPISVDEDLVLIAGAHRLAAAKNLGWSKIETKIFNQEDLQRELIEIDENLIRNELCYIAVGEHIKKRERILESLDKRRHRGSNRYSDDKDTLTTNDLALRTGTSNKMYRLKRQIADLIPEVRNALRGTDYARRNLNDLLHLSRQIPAVQRRVGELSNKDPRQTLKFHIDTANIQITTDRDKSQLVAELKKKWGVPFSIMRFDRENHQLAIICRQISKHTECRVIKGDVSGNEIPNYTGFVDHSLFLLEYFVRRSGSRVLDNFCGKGTNLIAGLWMGMEMHGFDLNPRLIDRIQDVVDEHLPDANLHLYNENGVLLQPLKQETESFDSILTDPPYLNCPDLYTEDPDDLSNMKQPEWEEKMREAFRNYYRLIKRSSVKDKTFYPLMLRMTSDPSEEAWTAAMAEAINRHTKNTNTREMVTDHTITPDFYPVIMKMNASRRAETGMVSMDFILARIAAEEGFTLWDRTFNILAPSAVSVSTLRNYDFHYTHKNWETTLIWIKQ